MSSLSLAACGAPEWHGEYLASYHGIPVYRSHGLEIELDTEVLDAALTIAHELDSRMPLPVDAHLHVSRIEIMTKPELMELRGDGLDVSGEIDMESGVLRMTYNPEAQRWELGLTFAHEMMHSVSGEFGHPMPWYCPETLEQILGNAPSPECYGQDLEFEIRRRLDESGLYWAKQGDA